MIKCSTPARPKGLKGNTSVISIRALNLKFVKHLGNKIPPWVATRIAERFPQKTKPMQDLTLGLSVKAWAVAILRVMWSRCWSCASQTVKWGAVAEFVHNPRAVVVELISNVNGAISSLFVVL